MNVSYSFKCQCGARIVRGTPDELHEAARVRDWNTSDMHAPACLECQLSH